MRIGLDVMGGDFYPNAPIEGAVLWAAQQPDDVELVLIGDEEVITSLLQQHHNSPLRYSIVHASEVITMEDHASKAILSKPNSSITIGLHLVKEKKIDAFISAGHSGAMLAGSVILLGCIEGVDRPTVAAIFPSIGDNCLVCDAGANLECKPENLVQFARLCTLFSKFVWKKPNPRVGLLNIGEEKKKGTTLIQQAHLLLEQQTGINFVGNMQGWDVLNDKADIYVVDGFTGNILLKFGESIYGFYKTRLPNDPDIDRFSAEAVGGIPFLGIKGNVILGHGVSGPIAFKNMLLNATQVVKVDLVAKIAQEFKV